MSNYRNRVKNLEKNLNRGKLSYSNTYVLEFENWKPEQFRKPGMKVSEKGFVSTFYLMRNVGSLKGELVRNISFAEAKQYNKKKLSLNIK